MGAGSMMNEMGRIPRPQAGQISGNPSAIRASSLAHAMPDVSWERFSGPARGLAKWPRWPRLAGIPNRQGCHERPQGMIRRDRAVIAMPMPSRWRHQIRKAI